MYLGCYKDSETSRDVNGALVTLTPMTVEKCATQCQSSGYPYAAMQLGDMCFCGNSYGSLGLTVGKYIVVVTIYKPTCTSRPTELFAIYRL